MGPNWSWIIITCRLHSSKPAPLNFQTLASIKQMIVTFQNLAFFFHKFKLEIYFCRHYGSPQFYLTDIIEWRNYIFVIILFDIALASQKKSVNQRKKTVAL